MLEYKCTIVQEYKSTRLKSKISARTYFEFFLMLDDLGIFFFMFDFFGLQLILFDLS